MANLKKIFKDIEALRAQISSYTKPFEGNDCSDGKSAQAARVERAANDLEFFARTYFPHYIKSPSSKLHKYLSARYMELVRSSAEHNGGSATPGGKEVDAAPRGNAKSTWTTLILPMWVTAFNLRNFVLIVSDTMSQSEDFISFIKAELESNERLNQDFPNITGEGKTWRADTLITKNGVKIRGVGAGQKLRGMRHGSRRPDLVICDDLENDEAVMSVEQRRKLEDWFFKALMKIGQKDTIYIVVGTVLHYDSLLSKLFKKPGWRGKKFKAIMRYSESKRWEEWENIFSAGSAPSGITKSTALNEPDEKETAETMADAYFNRHRDEMLADVDVLWPEVEDYYYLMKMRVSEGPAYFDSEKQNEPINPDDCLFSEHWIQYFDDASEPKNVPLYGVVDPSMGKKSKRHDPSAIICGRFSNGILYVTIADIERRHPDRIIEDILTYHRKERFQVFGVESVQFQEFFKDTLIKEAHRQNLTLNVTEIRSSADKLLRIQTLQPWIKNGWIRFKKSQRTLIEQLIRYPLYDHDDGPDALEMLKSLVEHNNLTADYETIAGRESVFKGKGSY
ncbi:MAG: phage terminase large subunit [Nitrospirae bacterium]|nr:phage terminase large subunit [Nitrospirota bacterium]MBF0536166.1 phage terminase large subunit [Nitrospirota bacterium]MBF0618209.1 phage terminase large subunit [Nitrospirota bacterium]